LKKKYERIKTKNNGRKGVTLRNIRNKYKRKKTKKSPNLAW